MNAAQIFEPLLLEIIKAGIEVWGNEFGFCGPPDLSGEEVVVAIFEAMISVCVAK